MRGARHLEYCQFVEPAWKQHLALLSKMASILCMVDCTTLAAFAQHDYVAVAAAAG
jgi:hypothetical protein